MSAVEVDERLGTDPVHRMMTIADAGTLRVAPDTGSSVRAGHGLVDGRSVVIFASDPRRSGGALGEADADAIVAAIRSAVDDHSPVVGIWQSGGARLQDGTSSLHGMGRIFRAIVTADVPLVSVVLGPAAGGAAYGPALTDFVVSGPDARIFVTGPDVVRRVTGEQVDAAGLGGPELHTVHSGVLHAGEPTDAAALEYARRLVGLLAARTRAHPVIVEPDPRPALIVPTSPRQVYDMHALVAVLLDQHSPWVELHRRWAPNIITGIGRLAGRTVGVLANNPYQLAGCLDCAASEKSAAFVAKCSALGVPLVVLVDVPGYLPGLQQESGGVVTRGARLLQAFALAEVPRVTVIIRKAYGGAFIAMNSKSLGATAVYAWPGAEVGVMYPSGAIDILHRRELAAAPPEHRDALRATLAQRYVHGAGGLRRALSCGHVDEVIEPARTRQVLSAAVG
jgi:acetyl-CoA/propionyl-CoA carboxylase carboxyl transferase subunit